MSTNFNRVREILDKAAADWQDSHHRQPILAKHDLGFGWQTRDQLLASTAFGLPLIDQTVIDNKDGENSNLVIALRKGVSPYPQMPISGPYVASEEIDEIVEWINGGAVA